MAFKTFTDERTGKQVKFASVSARDKYIRKLLRKQKRLIDGTTKTIDRGFSIDPVTEKRVNEGKGERQSKTYRTSHIKYTCSRFGKTK